jgi:hypothetical protein
MKVEKVPGGIKVSVVKTANADEVYDPEDSQLYHEEVVTLAEFRKATSPHLASKAEAKDEKPAKKPAAAKAAKKPATKAASKPVTHWDDPWQKPAPAEK